MEGDEDVGGGGGGSVATRHEAHAARKRGGGRKTLGEERPCVPWSRLACFDRAGNGPSWGGGADRFALRCVRVGPRYDECETPRRKNADEIEAWKPRARGAWLGASFPPLHDL